MIKITDLKYDPFDFEWKEDLEIHISEAHIQALSPFGDYTKVHMCDERQTFYVVDMDLSELSGKIDNYRKEFGFYNKKE